MTPQTSPSIHPLSTDSLPLIPYTFLYPPLTYPLLIHNVPARFATGGSYTRRCFFDGRVAILCRLPKTRAA
jgi:hypothetical protein